MPLLSGPATQSRWIKTGSRLECKCWSRFFQSQSVSHCFCWLWRQHSLTIRFCFSLSVSVVKMHLKYCFIFVPYLNEIWGCLDGQYSPLCELDVAVVEYKYSFLWWSRFYLVSVILTSVFTTHIVSTYLIEVSWCLGLGCNSPCRS